MASINSVASLISHAKKCSYQWNDETLCKFQEISTQNCILGRRRTLLLNSLKRSTNKNTEWINLLGCFSSDLTHRRDAHLLELLDNVLVFVQERFICSVDTWDQQSFSYFNERWALFILLLLEIYSSGLSNINRKEYKGQFLQYWIKPTRTQ